MLPKNLTRAFICIDFPDEVIKEITRIQHIIEKNAPSFSGKLTEQENLHLTLKFLNSINFDTLKKVKTQLSKINFPTLNLKLSHTGTFSVRKNPRIVWIKVIGKIFNLQKQIDETLKDLFKPEERFMSHLTIARIKYTKSPEIFQDYIKQIKIKKIEFQCDSFKLKSSELKPQGPIYSTIQEYKSNQPNQ